MMIGAKAVAPGGQDLAIDIEEITQCPLCHQGVEAVFTGQAFYGASSNVPLDLEAVFRCPRKPCHRLFVARYELSPFANAAGLKPKDRAYWNLTHIGPKTHKRIEFRPEIAKASSQFVVIFDQASAAEAAGLDQICGTGYRKALEFLIKDYLKSKTADEAKHKAIENAQLGACIANHIEDPSLKATASRAAWLGNDETHYLRKWGNKDLQDLKKLIDLTVHWVSVEILTKELQASMPDPKAAAIGAQPSVNEFP